MIADHPEKAGEPWVDRERRDRGRAHQAAELRQRLGHEPALAREELHFEQLTTPYEPHPPGPLRFLCVTLAFSRAGAFVLLGSHAPLPRGAACLAGGFWLRLLRLRGAAPLARG